MNPALRLEAFQKEAARGSRRVQQERVRFRSTRCSRSCTTPRITAHTYKHTTMGFLKDIEDMPNQYDHSLGLLRALVPRRQRRARRGRGHRPRRRLRAGAPLLRSVAPRGRTSDDPGRARSDGGARSRTSPWPAPTLPLVAMAFHVPAFDPGSVEVRALDVLRSGVLRADERAPPRAGARPSVGGLAVGGCRGPSRSGFLSRSGPRQGRRTHRRRARGDRAHPRAGGSATLAPQSARSGHLARFATDSCRASWRPIRSPRRSVTTSS